ncbi:hypothetical protein DKX38_026679 [Salix brachista]|uniref:Fe2OG dioxygenase domain-containing protein n=1 Tax=Salix brachista TaxID=2182728 RepID=A0A5N5JAA3_9ROSI|nr:hypothetical protein DKX38_026679 [Salix brachista]
MRSFHKANNASVSTSKGSDNLNNFTANPAALINEFATYLQGKNGGAGAHTTSTEEGNSSALLGKFAGFLADIECIPQQEMPGVLDLFPLPRMELNISSQNNKVDETTQSAGSLHMEGINGGMNTEDDSSEGGNSHIEPQNEIPRMRSLVFIPYDKYIIQQRNLLFDFFTQPELAMGIPPHSDHGLLTLLIQNGIGGLQIQHKGKWVNVGTHPNSFLVNTGDHLEILSNGRYKSVLHRAMVNNKGTRMSIAMAHGPSLDSVVSPAPELLVSSEGDEPAAYIGMKYKDYLELQQSNKLDGKSCLDRCPLIAMFVHAVRLHWHAITMAALLQMAGILAVDLMILHYQCMVHVPSSKWETFRRGSSFFGPFQM